MAQTKGKSFCKQHNCGLDEKLIQQIINKILSYKKPEKIVLYGSRATGDFKRVSDIDIAIFAKEWTGLDIAEIHFILEDEVDTLLKFDVADFYRLEKQSLIDNILKKGIILYESGTCK